MNVGLDRVVGHLAHPFVKMAANPERTARASRLTVSESERRRAEIDGIQIVDIRHPGEIAIGAISGSVELPVGQIPNRLGELDPTAPTVVFCAGGYRSSVAASVLRAAGFTDVSDLLGGYGSWLEFARA